MASAKAAKQHKNTPKKGRGKQTQTPEEMEATSIVSSVLLSSPNIDYFMPGTEELHYE